MPKKMHPPKPIVLNPEQQAVVDAQVGPIRCLAGAGAGKTAVLIMRYLKMLENGADPTTLLNLTFTASSARSMRERAEALRPAEKTSDRTSGWMTFHSLALSFCTQERENFPFKLAEFPLAPEPTSRKFMGEAARKFEIDPRSLGPWISLQKRSRVTAKEAVKIAEKEGKNEKQALAYKLYQSKLLDNGVLDFDSLITEMVELMSSKKDVQDRWSYFSIQADESQDNDENQWMLLKLMSEKHGNLCAVGDPNQNLYNFRGSSGIMFMDMASRFPGTQTMYLSHNYRSTKSIVEICKQCAPIQELAEKFYTDNEQGSDVKIQGFASSVDEANAVTLDVRNMDRSETAAVITRTNRALRVQEDSFSSNSIKYYTLSKSGFWTQPEVRAVLAYLGIVTSLSDGNVKIALNSPFWPTQYLKKKVISDEIKAKQKDDPNKPSAFKLLQEYRSSDPNQVKGVSSFVHFLFGLRRYQSELPQRALQSLLNDLKVKDLYDDQESIDNSPLENLQELVKISGRFNSIKEFLDYTRRASAASKKTAGIALGTVHASKGLQFDRVYLTGVNDGHLPHAKAESLDDERNIFYVGMSRAAKDLTISYAGIPSQFLQPFLAKPEESLEKVFEEVG